MMTGDLPPAVESTPPGAELIELADGPAILNLYGAWTIDYVAVAESLLERLSDRMQTIASVDVSRLQRMDMSGAYLLQRALGGGRSGPLTFIGGHEAAERLFQVAGASARSAPTAEAPQNAVIALLERVGIGVDLVIREGAATLSFFGQTLATMTKLVRRPSRIRWTSIFSVMEFAGLDALPVVSLLSFFIGIVVAYLGARTLSDFGVSVFTVELVGVSVFREFAVVITAVLLAGRTDSAFTAEIGAMKMRQEIDAMRVMGIDPMEALVAPRVMAMLVMTPILTFAAMIAGLAGGLIACWAYLHVSPAMFFTRIQDGVPAQHFWVGMSKAPIYAVVLAVVGCRHGLSVGGDVGSLGRRVTSAVVEAIFLIIALDAIFAMWFLEMRI